MSKAIQKHLEILVKVKNKSFIEHVHKPSWEHIQYSLILNEVHSSQLYNAINYIESEYFRVEFVKFVR